MHAAQVGVVRRRRGRSLADEIRESHRFDLCGHGIRYGLRKIGLQRHDSGRVAVVATRPEMAIVAGTDEPRVETHTLALAGDGALDDGIDAQFPHEGAERRVQSLVVHRGCARDDSE